MQVANGNAGAVSRQEQCGRGSDAAAGSGNDRDAMLEVLWVVHVLVLLRALPT
jgi:hypothetical protein